jgi:hypothetical protein
MIDHVKEGKITASQRPKKGQFFFFNNPFMRELTGV